jgi:hypothetical protein
MQKSKKPPLTFEQKIAVLTLVATLVVIPITLASCAFSGFLAPTLQHLLNLDPFFPASTPTSFTQSGKVDLSPDSAIYFYKISTWSKPAYNTYCQLEYCDPSSKRKDTLLEGTTVTAMCWTNGQLVITGTVTNPGYEDSKWVRLKDGTYLPNLWFVRTKLSPQLPFC